MSLLGLSAAAVAGGWARLDMFGGAVRQRTTYPEVATLSSILRMITASFEPSCNDLGL